MFQGFQIEVVGAVAILIALIVWFVRLEGRVNRAEERTSDLGILLAAYKVEHDKEIDRALSDSRENNKILWEKVDSMQKAISEVLKSLGRLEGKLEATK